MHPWLAHRRNTGHKRRERRMDVVINLDLPYVVRKEQREQEGGMARSNLTISDGVLREGIASRYPSQPVPGTTATRPGGPKAREERTHVAAVQKALTVAVDKEAPSIVLSRETTKFLFDTMKDATFSAAHSDMNSWAEDMIDHLSEVLNPKKAEAKPAETSKTT